MPRLSWRDRDTRVAALVTGGIWFGVWLLHIAVRVAADDPRLLEGLGFEIVSVALIATLSFCFYPLALAIRGWRLRWPVFALALVALALLHAGVGVVTTQLRGATPAYAPYRGLPLDEATISRLMPHFFVLLANCLALAVIVEVRRSADAQLQLIRAEASAEHARLVALRLQLNPHFLFNALNALSSLVVLKRTEQAEEMLERLVDFLRASLSADPDALVPLEEETAALDAYLAIEAVRFGERLIVELDPAPGLARAAVPSFILQPLVENAVKYGVARSRDPVTVRMRARTEGKRLILTVDDDGADLPVLTVAGAAGKAGLGVGLANVRQRLAALFGDDACFHKARVDGRFTATLSLPLRFLDQP